MRYYHASLTGAPERAHLVSTRTSIRVPQRSHLMPTRSKPPNRPRLVAAYSAHSIRDVGMSLRRPLHRISCAPGSLITAAARIISNASSSESLQVAGTMQSRPMTARTDLVSINPTNV